MNVLGQVQLDDSFSSQQMVKHTSLDRKKTYLFIFVVAAVFGGLCEHLWTYKCVDGISSVPPKQNFKPQFKSKTNNFKRWKQDLGLVNFPKYSFVLQCCTRTE